MSEGMTWEELVEYIDAINGSDCAQDLPDEEPIPQKENAAEDDSDSIPF